jgi:hypothetical protein
MTPFSPQDFRTLYDRFEAPITRLDCGKKCAPYNGGVPFCCDTQHAVPTAYRAEWVYLQQNTDLWHLWEPEDTGEKSRLAQEAGNLILIECQGHQACQRGYRSLVCRAFPFFPYFDSTGRLLGLSYYWDYEDRCWVLSNLQVVSHTYLEQFSAAYRAVFAAEPGERENFMHHSQEMRRIFRTKRRAIPLLHLSGKIYKISPGNERMRRVAPDSLQKHGPYAISDVLLFPDEIENVQPLDDR